MSMSTADQLIRAIKERIVTGTEKESIKSETIAAGHSEEIFEAAYLLAKKELDSKSLQDRELPSAWSLFTDGLRFARRHWKLSLLVGAPLVVTVITPLIMDQYQSNWLVILLGLLITIAAMLIHFVLLFAVLKLVGQKTEQLDYKAAFAWARANFWKGIWVYLLTTLAVWGGLVLFIVPGIIVGVTLYFSIYVLVNEGIKGETALLRSRDLVKGRWWTVFGKVFGVGFLSILLFISFMIVASMIAALLDSVVSQGIITEFINVISQFVGAAVTIVILHAGNHLYLLLKESTSSEETRKGLLKYRILIGISIITFVSVIALAIIIGRNDEFRAEVMSGSAEESLQIELFTAKFVASSYAFSNNDSYEGVCEQLLEVVTNTDEIVCNDNTEAWAVAATKNGEQWCADSTDYRKPLEGSLEDRTNCFPL